MVSYRIVALAVLYAIIHLATDLVVSAFNTGRYHRIQKQCTSYAQNKYLPQRSFEICMSDEDIEQTKPNNDNPIKQYFNNINSQLSSSVRSTTQTDAIGQQQQRKNEEGNDILRSSVRSTTQTDALGRKEQRQRTIDDNEEEGDDIPPEVLQPFSLLLLSQFILFLGVGAVIPTIPLYGQSIGLSAASNGVVISAPAVALLLISRIAGEYSDLGRKKAMMGGMLCIAISDVGTAYSNSLATLVLARLGLGLGRGYAEAGERGMLTDLANKTPQLRGRALALQQACVALGIALGAPLGGIVVEEYGARSAFLCVSAAALVSLTIYSILPETLLKEERIDTESSSSTRETSEDNSGANWIDLLQTSATWRSLALAQSGSSFGFACKIAVIPIIANEVLGGAAGAGFLLSAAGLAGLVGAPLGGFLTDKAGSRVAASFGGLLSGGALCLVPLGLSLEGMDSTITTAIDGSGSLSLVERLASLSISSEAAAFCILVILWSIGASAQGPALTALGQENAPLGSEATALGLPRAVGDGTYIVAPLILGYFSDKYGGTIPGISCTIAGSAICLGSFALLLLDKSTSEDVKIDK